MAIGFANGCTHIYDSRNRRKVLEFIDENLPRRISGVAWAPSEETRLVLASEDDRSPTMQFWDLRKARAPTLEFVGHRRGVTDVAWCCQDSGLILSSGKDAQSIVWDARSGERLGCLLPNDPSPAIQVSLFPPFRFAALCLTYNGDACAPNSHGTDDTPAWSC
jgi:WD40 repeat protein